MKRLTPIARIVPLVMLIVACATPSYAFQFAGAGAKVGMLDPEGSDNAPVVSAHMEFDQPNTHWHLMPSMLLWNSNSMTGLNGNVDMYYHFVSEGSASPYAGTGIGIDHFDPSGPDNGSTRPGLNLFGGVRFPMSSGHLFMEGRYTASRYSQVSLMGGVTFLGR